MRGIGLQRSLVLCLLTCLFLAAPASAQITASSISSPANGTELFFNGDNGSGSVTVQGTVTGATPTAKANLVCYSQSDTKATVIVSGISVGSGTFAINASLLPVAGQACRLAIVPTGAPKTGADAAVFQGPAISVTDQFSHSSAGSLFGYYILAGTLPWSFAFQSAGECPVHASYSTDSGTLTSYTLFGLDSGSLGVACLPQSSGVGAAAGTRAAIQIDGQNAYLPGAIPALTSRPGFIPLTYATLFNPLHDAGGISETDAPMICNAPASFPPTTNTCPSLRDSGIRVQQTSVLLPGGQVARVTQTFTSADGRAHTLDLLFGHSVSAPQSGEQPGFQLPGQSSFATHAEPDMFSQFPPGAGSIIVISTNNGFLPATSNPIGAITYNRPPLSADFITPRGAQTATMLLHYVDTVPAGGAIAYDWSFQQASSSSSLQTLEAIERDHYGSPSVTIVNPHNRAVTTKNEVRIQGAVSDSVGISSLNVNGRSVVVRAGGAFGITLGLRPGQNPITATVTNIAGNTANATVTVEYKPPPPCSVPNLRGKSLSTARRKLIQSNCSVGKIKQVRSKKVRKGQIVSSNPRAGTRHRHGWKVGLWVSRGK